MEGKTVLITGANSGIGKETAREMARQGARVIMACRNQETANAAREEIVKETGNNNVIIKKIDLGSQRSVREFAADILKTENKLDVLIHNAGMALAFRGATSEDAAYLYYVSKYANIYFARELAQRLEGSGITVNFLHPGMIDSGIWRNVPFPLNYPMLAVTKCFFKTPKQGAETTIYLASSKDVEGVSGKYFMDKKEHGLSAAAMDMDKAKKIWEESAKIVGLTASDPKI
ncbi:unnamed protein product [Hermetia illucens]|uniref:Uncharacterized protein n=1 Tax=Hermetia illucens TaxID=343691 RepID=A0A7R8UPY3_HERIL|nr:unnamed protein product [Hermetia illucens]